MSVRNVLNLLAVATCAITLAGCAEPGFFSLGGTIPTENLGKTGTRYKANFGGFIDACDLENVNGHVTYQDKYASTGEIRLEGLVTNAAECVAFSVSGLEAGCLQCRQWIQEATGEAPPNVPEEGYLGYAEIRYRSQDTKTFGKSNNGIAYVCVADFGEGSKAPKSDFLLLNITSGPYEGYRNYGPVQGNINHEGCVN